MSPGLNAIVSSHLVYILLTLTPTVNSALPPGYGDDHLLCQPAATSCLRPRPQPRGWCGPRTMFVECCDTATGAVSRPRGWGWRLDAGYLHGLLRQGWGEVKQCTAEEARLCGEVRTKAVALAMVEGVVDRLVGMRVVGLW